MVEIKDLTFYYKAGTRDEVRALFRVGLSINKGEFVAVIGRNGSGKSTLAKHLIGLLIPTGGEVSVGGLSTGETGNIREIRKKVGMVFQNPDNQLVSTVVEEDVAFGPENIGIPPLEIRQRVDWALEIMHMAEFRHESPARLSGGQKQRVAIAGVLAMKPDCIVLDESTALLDPVGRREVLDSITRLNREEGITVIFITHFMEEAIEFDRILVMEDGQVEMDGAPRQIFKNVDRIRRLGLNIPVPLQIAIGLNSKGFAVEPDILNVEELVTSICQLK